MKTATIEELSITSLYYTPSCRHNHLLVVVFAASLELIGSETCTNCFLLFAWIDLFRVSIGSVLLLTF